MKNKQIARIGKILPRALYKEISEKNITVNTKASGSQKLAAPQMR